MSLVRRFVGWVTNFIHNRKDPDVNMLRGYLTSTVGRSIPPVRLEIIRARVQARSNTQPKTGFIKRSSDALDVVGKTQGGSGEIKYKLYSRNHTKPKYKRKKQRILRKMVASFARQMQVEDFVPPERVLSLTAGISFNGKAWAQGTGCLFYLEDDARGQSKPRVGQVIRFLALDIDDVEEFFVEITEHAVLRWQRSIAVVDLTRRTKTRITHAGHIVSLAAYAPYWEPQFTQYKCVTPVSDTY
jgi:hypothetical protein